MKAIVRIWVVFACWLLAACDPVAPEDYRPAFSDDPPPGSRRLVFGVHPLHNPHRLFQVYQPLVDYLNRNLPTVRLRLEASRDYADFEKKIASRYFHFALPNPYQTIAARQYGYRVFGKAGNDEDFRGLILVRKDGGIKEPADLRGKPVSFPAPTALAASMMPQRFLHDAGLNVRSDILSTYVGSQESAIMTVYLGKSAAGATWPPPWRTFVKEHPDKAAELEVRWQTAPLVNNGLVARDDMPAEVVDGIRRLVAGLQDSEEGRVILARMELNRFEVADDSGFQPVADFVAAFERDIRPAKEP